MNNIDVLTKIKNLESPDASFFSKDPSLVFERAAGSIIYDVESRPFIDLCAGFGALALGHNPKEHQWVWRDLLGETPGRIVHAMGDVYSALDKAQLFSFLSRILPQPLESIALSLSGSQAVEYALKTAMLFTKREAFICLNEAYHGLDVGALNLSFREDFKRGFEPWLHRSKVEFVDPSLEGDNFLSALSKARLRLKVRGFDSAGLIIEPLQGRAGGRELSLSSLRSAQDFCRESHTLLIFDEVFTGLGRLGRWSTAELVGCDILCLGKALGGGLPLSATISSRKIMGAWGENQGEARHTGTFFGHPLSCRLGLASLKAIEDQNLLERSFHLGSETRKHLETTFARRDGIKKISGCGLMIYIEFNKAGLGATAMNELRRLGVIALASGSRGESLAITPALNIPREILSEALQKISKVIDQLC